MIRAVWLIASLGPLVGCNLRDALSANVDTVARAGRHELTVTSMAELLAGSRDLPIRRDVVEGVAMIWVDYTLFVDRWLGGDSLLDSASVVAARWPDVQQLIANRYHEQLVTQVAGVEGSALDSIYQVGEWRLIKHILFTIPTDAPEDFRAGKRRMAVEMLNRLRTNRTTWADASQVSEEPEAGPRQGSLGVIARGEMVTTFENAAYELAPGAVSDLVETQFGLHIVFRPNLDEVRADFAAGVRVRMESTFDQRYLEELPDRYGLEVRAGAASDVRELVQDISRSPDARGVLGTWRDGGRFRGADFMRWVRGMDPQVRAMILGATDEQLQEMVRSLMRNELLLQEARVAGIDLTPIDMANLTEQVSRELALLRAAIGLLPDTVALLTHQPVSERQVAGQRFVLRYLGALGNNQRRFQQVPQFLGDRLRTLGSWEIVPAGIERALQHAQQLRTALDSVAPAQRDSAR
jgi:hypothetical protein